MIKEELPQIFEAFKRIDAKDPRYHPTLSVMREAMCGEKIELELDTQYKDCKKGRCKLPGLGVLEDRQ